MDKKYCPYCMTKLSDEGGRCPNCQLTDGSYQPKPFHIPPGAILRDRYLVGKVIGEGGFGITYIGCDLILDRKVAIKEYYPRERVNRVSSNSLNVEAYFGEQGSSYEEGKNKFLNEARVMAMLTKEPTIVRVQDFFECNNTAYIVMEYIEGTTLSELIVQKGGKISPNELFSLVEPLFGALQTMHGMDFVHRDISPDNIMIERGQVRLLDFGCAREAVSKSETLSIMLKPGFAPIEQYQQYGQGQWTDVYALCATLYYCLTGTKPPLSVERMISDKLVPPRKLGVNITQQQENALLAGLRVVPGRRTQTMNELHAELYGKAPVPNAGSLTVISRVIGAKGTMPDIRFVIHLSGKDVDPDGTYGDVTLSGGKASVTVKGESRILISDIPAGTDYRIESDIPADFRVSSTRPEGTIEKNASMMTTFEFAAIEKPVGSLSLKSKFIGAGSTDEKSCKLAVELSGDTVEPNGRYGGVEFKDGTAEIIIKNGMKTVISGIPAGTSYRIQAEELEGFKVAVSNDEGMIENGITKNVRFDYKKLGKKPAGAVEADEALPEKKSILIPIIAVAVLVILITAANIIALVVKNSNSDNQIPDEPPITTDGSDSNDKDTPDEPPSENVDDNAPETSAEQDILKQYVPEYEIFHYDFTDGHPDDWWENTDVHGLSQFSAEYYLFTDALRAEGAKIVIRADSAKEWQYSLISYDWWSGNVRVDCNFGKGGEGDMAADAAIATDDGAIIIIDAGEMISIFEAKGLDLTNYTAWINGNGGNTYSISVYAPEPKSQMYEIFHYDFTDGKSDNWWEYTDLNSNTADGVKLFRALRVDGAKIVVTNDSAAPDEYHWLYALQSEPGREFVSVGPTDDRDMMAEGAIKDGDRMKAVIDAGALMSAFASKGLSLNNYTAWINGAGNDFDTYSISVYAPEPAELSADDIIRLYLEVGNSIVEVGSDQVFAEKGSNNILIDLSSFKKELASYGLRDFIDQPSLAINFLVPDYMFEFDADAVAGDLSNNEVEVRYSYSDIVIKADGYKDVIIPAGKGAGTIRGEKTENFIVQSSPWINVLVPVTTQLGLDKEQLVTEYLPHISSLEMSIDIESVKSVELAPQNVAEIMSEHGLNADDFTYDLLQWLSSQPSWSSSTNTAKFSSASHAYGYAGNFGPKDISNADAILIEFAEPLEHEIYYGIAYANGDCQYSYINESSTSYVILLQPSTVVEDLWFGDCSFFSDTHRNETWSCKFTKMSANII